jgi:CubicO group peptidase (beta-lactamase class C family)
MDRYIEDGLIRSAAVVVGSSQETLGVQTFGRQTLDEDASPILDDPIFLIASPTKPIVALGLMMLVETGQLKLADRIAEYVPEFAVAGKRSITVGHCLTHTSGLPDMLPDNEALRTKHAPLEEFVAGVCELKPDFPPGRQVQYQSMGILILGEVVTRVTGRPLGRWLAEQLFEPLEMSDTTLGMPDDWDELPKASTGPTKEDRIVEIPTDGSPFQAVWNSRYWRGLGAPWGGLLSSPADLARLCRHLLEIHDGRDGVISRATLAAMTRNQLPGMAQLPEAASRATPWGLGWRLNWPGHATSFGDLLSPAVYGHWGATGTLVWIDPRYDAFLVALTNRAWNEGPSLLTNLSNSVCAALV